MKYPISIHQFGAYFHQDWDLGGPDWESIVDLICKHSNDETLIGWIVELKIILKTFSDDNLDSARYSLFGIYYIPFYDGMSNREWFQQVVQRVEAYLQMNRGLSSEK